MIRSGETSGSSKVPAVRSMGTVGLAYRHKRGGVNGDIGLRKFGSLGAALPCDPLAERNAIVFWHVFPNCAGFGRAGAPTGSEADYARGGCEDCIACGKYIRIPLTLCRCADYEIFGDAPARHLASVISILTKNKFSKIIAIRAVKMLKYRFNWCSPSNC